MVKRRKVTEWVWQSLYATGAFHLANACSKRFPKILVYHRFGTQDQAKRIGVAAFERQVQVLAAHFNVFSLGALCTLLKQGTAIPSNTVILTIDDGYEDFYLYAYPILKKYSLPATVYVTTDFTDEKVWLWPDFIEFVIHQSPLYDYTFQVDGKAIQYQLKTDGMKAWSDVADYCLTLKTDAKIQFLKQFAVDLKVAAPPIPEPEYRALSWEQIREMRGHGIEIGSHTCTHPRLAMTDDSDLIYEIEGSKKRIETMLGEAVESFCYPHGAKVDFDSRSKALVKGTGYRNAVAGYFDLNVTDDLFELRRYGVGSDIMDFIKIVYGIEFLSKALGRG